MIMIENEPLFESDKMNSDNSSLETSREIIRGLKGDDDTQTNSLKQLSTLLDSTVDQTTFPFGIIAPELIRLLISTESDQVRMLSSLCICKILDQNRAIETEASFSNISFIQNLAEKLMNANTVTVEYFIHILSIFVDRKPGRIGQFLGVKTFLYFFDKVSLQSQRECLQTISKLTTRFVVDKFNEDLKPLLDIFMNSKDPIIRQYSISSFTNIATKITPSIMPISVLSPLANIIPILNDYDTAILFMKILYRASKDPVAVSQLLQDPPNFEKLLFSGVATANLDVCQQILEIIQIMIAPPCMPKGLWPVKNKSHQGCEQFTKDIEPVLVSFLSKKQFASRRSYSC